MLDNSFITVNDATNALSKFLACVKKECHHARRERLVCAMLVKQPVVYQSYPLGSQKSAAMRFVLCTG